MAQTQTVSTLVYPTLAVQLMLCTRYEVTHATLYYKLYDYNTAIIINP